MTEPLALDRRRRMRRSYAITGMARETVAMRIGSSGGIEEGPLPTLQEIADHAGFHRSTVALALRDHVRISAKTRDRIKTIAASLGYCVDPLVAALVQSRRASCVMRHSTLALVTSHSTRFGWQSTHPERPDYFHSAQVCARQLGYSLEPFWYAEPGMTPARFHDILVTRDIHGLIIAPVPVERNTLNLRWDQFSSVALGMSLQSPHLSCVTEDHFDNAWQAMDRCLERGYRRMGLVFAGESEGPQAVERRVGALMLRQMTLPAADRVPPCPGWPTDGATFTEWFRRQQPDALVVTQACPVRPWLRALGVEVPRDVGLIELRGHPDSATSGVYADPGVIASRAVEMLVGLLHYNRTGVPQDHCEVMFTGKWREGMTLPWYRG